MSLSRAIRAGDFVFLTGQLPFRQGELVTSGTVEELTRLILDEIKSTLALAHCEQSDLGDGMAAG